MKKTIIWKGKEYKVPSMKTLEKYSDCISRTPDGKKVEPDHPDSWLVLLGLM